MRAARILLYAHCVVAIACVALAIFVREQRYQWGWRFDRQMEVIWACPGVPFAFLLCLLSCFGFPAALAYSTGGRISAWQRWLIVIADTLLGLVQLLAILLLELPPVRE
jgi:cytochrome c biogenesis protein CcdA